MTKAELMQLVTTSENGATLRVNNFCTLRRQTIAPWNEKVDRVWLDLFAPCGYGRFTGAVEIKTRDYDGVKEEVQAAIKNRMDELTEYLCSAVKNGYTA